MLSPATQRPLSVRSAAWLTALLMSVAGHASGKSFYEDALQRYENKDYDGAIIQLKNALQKEPNQLAIQFQMGLALQQTGDAVGAEEALSEALRLGISRSEVVVPLAQTLVDQGRQREMLAHPQLQPSGLPDRVTQELLLVRARAWMDMGSAREALSSIQQARAIDPRQAESWLTEVPLRIRNGQFDLAMQAANRALELSPGDAEAYYVRGSVHHSEGRLGPAMADYEQALTLERGHREALVAKAGLQIDKKDWAAAQETLARLKESSPREPRGAYLRALLAQQQGRTDEARAALQEITRLVDPVPVNFLRFRPQTLMLNGLAHHGLGQWAKARQYLEAVLKIQPGSPAVRVVAGIHLKERNPAAAVPLLEAYLRAHPDDGMALTLLAAANLAQGKSARASRLLQEALTKEDRPEYRTALGLSFLQSGQQAEAMSELENAWRRDPKQLQAGMALANLYSRQGQHKEALKVSKELVKRHPEHAPLQSLLGDLQMKAGLAEEARKSYEKAMSLAPDMAGPQLQLARLDVQAGQLDAAEKRLNDMLRESPRFSDAMAELARIHERRGRNDEALRWLLRARETSTKGDLRWNLALMEWHMRQGRLKDALEEGKIALAKQPESIPTLLLHARIQLGLGDAPGARATLGSATRFAEFNANTLTEVAQLQFMAGDVDGAAYSLEKALSDTPEHLAAQSMMVQIELRRGNTAQAEARARQVIKQYPKNAAGHGLLGDVALSRNDLPQAVAAYRQAHQVEPSSVTTVALTGSLARMDARPEAVKIAQQRLKQAPRDLATRMTLGHLHAQMGRYADAAAVYREVVKQRPRHVEALNSLANALLKLNHPEALATARAAHELAPENPMVIDTLGWVFFKQGKFEEALPLLRDARLRAPGNAEIRYHLARVLTATGRKSEAKRELQEALRLATKFEGADDARALLQSLQ